MGGVWNGQTAPGWSGCGYEIGKLGGDEAGKLGGDGIKYIPMWAGMGIKKFTCHGWWTGGQIKDF